MLVRQPILLDIRRDKVFVKSLKSNKFYEGELFIWTKKNNLGKDIVISVGDSYKTVDQQHLEQDCEKNKVFYNREGIIIDDFEKAAIAIKYLMTEYCNRKNEIVKPIMIWNCPEDLSKVEVRSLKEVSDSAGGREFTLLREKDRPREDCFQPNQKIPFYVVYGIDRYTSDEKILVFIAFGFCVLGYLLYLRY